MPWHTLKLEAQAFPIAGSKARRPRPLQRSTLLLHWPSALGSGDSGLRAREEIPQTSERQSLHPPPSETLPRKTPGGTPSPGDPTVLSFQGQAASPSLKPHRPGAPMPKAPWRFRTSAAWAVASRAEKSGTGNSGCSPTSISFDYPMHSEMGDTLITKRPAFMPRAAIRI